MVTETVVASAPSVHDDNSGANGAVDAVWNDLPVFGGLAEEDQVANAHLLENEP